MSGQPDFNIKQDDLQPPFVVVVTDELGQVIDLSDAVNPRFRMRRFDTKDIIIDALAEILVPPSGVIQYGWAKGDTDEWGLYEAEFSVDDAQGNPLSFPNNAHYTVSIIERIK